MMENRINKKFKSGKIVVRNNKNPAICDLKEGDRAVIVLMPGQPDYDKKNFGCAEEGMLVWAIDSHKTYWQFQYLYNLAPPME